MHLLLYFPQFAQSDFLVLGYVRFPPLRWYLDDEAALANEVVCEDRP